MKAINSILAIAFFAVLLLSNCKKADVGCNDDPPFCNLISSSNFEDTKPIVNAYLNTLQKNDAQALEKLVEWLACKSCVKTAELLCNSCVFTLPPQSEIRIEFITNAGIVTKIFDISMQEKLSFIAYHD